MSTACPACGNPASGKFCSQCGTPLANPLTCAECGNELPVGGRFCNMCGIPVGIPAPVQPAAASGAAPGSPAPPNRVPWIVAGAAVLALAVFLVFGRSTTPASPPAGAPPFAADASGASAVDLASMTPRQAADSLFNRVMRSVEANDSMDARRFAPMAVAAYEMAAPLDLDGRYHLAILHLVNNDPEAARAETAVILTEVPTHLFGLFTAGQAEDLAGNRDRAVERYDEFLRNYDAEVSLDRPEYLEHARVLPAMRDQAEERIR